MTPEQKIKREILWEAIVDGNLDLPGNITEENVDEDWRTLVEKDLHWDYVSDYREGQVETGLPSDWNRNYECKEVATQLSDGSWVGWTYWYGGGKHGQPEAIEWMPDAYDIVVTEEWKVVREFKKVEHAH